MINDNSSYYINNTIVTNNLRSESGRRGRQLFFEKFSIFNIIMRNERLSLSLYVSFLVCFIIDSLETFVWGFHNLVQQQEQQSKVKT